ncbi:hypothetical protein ZWY2020_037775 [Hordeum vulgare]|nr:hypothetical protein ZWY2020_037775 [Hordeum vulgare]
MVSSNDPSSGISSDNESLTNQIPRMITSKEWKGVAEDLPACGQHQSPSKKLGAFESTYSWRKFLGCAKKLVAFDIEESPLVDTDHVFPELDMEKFTFDDVSSIDSWALDPEMDSFMVNYIEVY